MNENDPEPPVLHVLVVEDDAEQREGMVAALTRMGCRVTAAKDGDEAIRLVRAERPPLVLMDLQMPQTDGWDVIRNIRERARKNEDAQPPYIIAYSGMVTMDARRAAFDAGCNEFVAKPLDVGGAIRAYATRHGFNVSSG